MSDQTPTNTSNTAPVFVSSEVISSLAHVVDAQGASADGYGSSVAVNGAGTIVVGAPRDSEGNVYAGGSVVVRQPDGVGGVTELKLTAPDGDYAGQFGTSVSINEGGVVVVGSTGDNESGYQSGAIYVYVPDGSGGFADPVKLTATEGNAGSQFGSAVAISNNGIIVSGAPQSSGEGL
ncbi:hypothetical protein, partial [Pseudovibrio sp. POLY-S9]|uniref:hypothetical protein n=1 Tax=Pseudovibrio sp. POLY-S9 TaxID=1576596 RepID=UPI000ABD1936